MVDPGATLDLRAYPFLRYQFSRGLEEIHVQSEHIVKVIHDAHLFFRIIPCIPDGSSGDGPVLLLHEAVVVFPQRPRTGEGDVFVLAIIVQMMVDKGRVIVRVQAEQREGQSASNQPQCLENPLLGLAFDRTQFSSTPRRRR